jgi:hypothetical protein
MLGPPDHTVRFAPWWFDRAHSFNDVCIICNVPFHTTFRWLQLIQAIGLFFGEKRGREWLFDCHELYVFRVLTAFYRAGIPVGPTQIRAVILFAFGDDGTPRMPEGKLIQSAPEAEFSVDAVRIFNAIVDATNPEIADAE